jgi:hypothetical protein
VDLELASLRSKPVSEKAVGNGKRGLTMELFGMCSKSYKKKKEIDGCRR